ncbi:hypothetical protein CLAIMM_00006, partial [Cladophialophora immunda]
RDAFRSIVQAGHGHSASPLVSPSAPRHRYPTPTAASESCDASVLAEEKRSAAMNIHCIPSRKAKTTISSPPRIVDGHFPSDQIVRQTPTKPPLQRKQREGLQALWPG